MVLVIKLYWRTFGPCEHPVPVSQWLLLSNTKVGVTGGMDDTVEMVSAGITRALVRKRLRPISLRGDRRLSPRLASKHRGRLGIGLSSRYDYFGRRPELRPVAVRRY
jgi:hypothetical protein